MGISGLISGAAGLFGLGSGIAGLVGGAPAQNVQLPQSPFGGYEGAAAGGAFQGTQGLGQYNLFDPGTAGNLSYGIVNNPYQGQFQQGAGTAGQLGQAAGIGQFGAGANLYGTGQQLGANVLANQPGGQQPLYNFLQNQNLQQANAENAMAGISTTPYGAGVADTSNQLFNLNWQNFLQQQQLQAAQGQGQAYGQAAALQGQAPGQYLAGAGLPYGTANQIAGQGLGALGGLQSYGQTGAQIPQQQISNYQNIANQGFGQQAQTAGLGLQQTGQAFGQNQAFGQDIGWGLGMLANRGGPSYGWGGGAPGYFGSYGGTTGGLGGLY